MHDENTSDLDDATRGISRRTIMQGAAWSIPVVALATASPAMAASEVPELTLAFELDSYSVAPCGTLTDVVITATEDGLPAASTQVSVTPPAGTTWADGSTAARILLTDTDGRIELSDDNALLIDSSAAGSSLTLTATAVDDTASASTTLDVGALDDQSIRWVFNSSGDIVEGGTIPADEVVTDVFATSDGGTASWRSRSAVLTESGNLYSVNGDLLASGIVAANIGQNNSGTTYIVAVTTSGEVLAINPATGNQLSYGSIPASETVVAVDTIDDSATGEVLSARTLIRTASGNLYSGYGTLLASDVVASDIGRDASDAVHAVYVTADGSIQALSYATQDVTSGGTLPAGETAVDVAVTDTQTGESLAVRTAILTDAGNLYDFDGNLLAGDVVAIETGLNHDGVSTITYVTSDNVIHTLELDTMTSRDQGTLPAAIADIATSDDPLVAYWSERTTFLTTDGGLYRADGTLLDSGVQAISVGRNQGNSSLGTVYVTDSNNC